MSLNHLKISLVYRGMAVEGEGGGGYVLSQEMLVLFIYFPVYSFITYSANWRLLNSHWYIKLKSLYIISLCMRLILYYKSLTGGNKDIIFYL